MLGWLVLCFTSFSAVPNAANIAHLAGLLCGMLLAALPMIGATHGAR
jgi:membrane associated rhomboid family serine protease